MIIDSLTHVTPDGRWFGTDIDASEDRLLREMDAVGVEKAVVVALAGYIDNDFVIRACARHAGRLVPGASFNPAAHHTPEAAAAALRAELKGAPFRVLKLHPRLNQYDPLDPRNLAVLAELAAWQTPPPVWLDSLFYRRGVTLRAPIVDTIHRIVTGFPSLTFAVLHGGGAWLLPVAEAVRDCPNVFVDLSYTLCHYAGSSLEADMRWLLKHFDRRVLFGSDFPEIGIGEALVQFGRLAQGVPPTKRDHVLGANLRALLDVEA